MHIDEKFNADFVLIRTGSSSLDVRLVKVEQFDKQRQEQWKKQNKMTSKTISF